MIGHGHGGGTGGEDVGHRGAGGDLGVGGGIGADDVARDDGLVTGLGGVARGEPGAVERVEGIGLAHVDDVGHGHGGGTGGEDVGHRGAGGDLGVGGGIGADDVARDDGLVTGLGGVARGEPGAVERVEGIGLAHVDDVGHSHGGGTGGEDVGHRGAGGDLGVGGGIGADDVARDDGLVTGLGGVARGEPGAVERVEGIGLAHVDDVGHGHGGGTGGEDVGHRGAGGDLGVGGGIGADDVARDDGLVTGLGGVARGEPGAVERVEGIGLAHVDDVGHGHGGGTGGEDVGHRGAGGDLGVGGGIGADDVARDDGLVTGLGGVARGEPGAVERVEGIGLAHVDDVGHSHELRPHADEQIDFRALRQFGIDGRIRTDDAPGGNLVTELFGDVADHEARVSEGLPSVFLAQTTHVRHGVGRYGPGHGQIDGRAFLHHLSCRRILIEHRARLFFVRFDGIDPDHEPVVRGRGFSVLEGHAREVGRTHADDGGRAFAGNFGDDRAR